MFELLDTSDAFPMWKVENYFKFALFPRHREKRGIWIFIFPDGENTHLSKTISKYVLPPTLEKFKGCNWVMIGCY